MNRKTAFIAAVPLVAAALLSPPLRAGEVTVTYRFAEPAVVATARGFTRIELPGAIQAGRPGEPGYPFRGVSILLPPGEAVSGVRIERRGWKELGGSYRLHPVQPVVPGLETDPDDAAAPGFGTDRRQREFLLNSAAYAEDRWMQPPDAGPSTRYLCGHGIAVGALSPVRYHPARGAVGYFSEVEVTVETAPRTDASAALTLLRTDDATEQRLRTIVDNPGALASYGGPALTTTPGDDYEYMIVTRDSLRDAFVPFRDFHNRRGARTAIWTVEEIERDFPGSDTAEKIRNAVIHEYVNNGISFLLLGGDADGPPGEPHIVPYRGLSCAVQSYPELYEDDHIPADLYFAALDGSWNADGDSLWGEPGEEDFYSEIAVGRVCAETAGQVAIFSNKTMLYQDTPVAGEVRRALLLGEKLYTDPLTYGGDEMDQLVGTCTAYGFTTTGIPTDFDVTTLYDRDLGTWSKTLARDAINGGTHWVAHAGHCNWIYALRQPIADITDVNFTNDGVGANLTIIYTYGCYAAAFDNQSSLGPTTIDCIGEKMAGIEHCAVALFGNSRYGWFTEGTTNGPSHHFQREFYDAVFTEGYHTLGEANRRSKDETVPFIDLPEEYETGAHRWCFYTLNLLGDPALDAWTDTPESLAVSHPATCERYGSTLEIETPGVSSAVATLYHDGVCYGRGVGSPEGHIVLQRYLPLPDSIEAIELDVSAHNHYTYRAAIGIDGVAPAANPIPRLALAQNTPNPFNPSTVIRFELDGGGIADLRVYDVAGREVERLLPHRILPPGVHTVTWRPRGLPSGVYLYVLRAGGRTLSRKAVLLK